MGETCFDLRFSVDMRDNRTLFLYLQHTYIIPYEILSIHLFLLLNEFRELRFNLEVQVVKSKSCRVQNNFHSAFFWPTPNIC